MKQLNSNTVDSKTFPLRLMQFGGGNFLRAFVDYMVDILNEQTEFNCGIVIIKPTEGGDYSLLKSQNGMYHVLLDGIIQGKVVSEQRLITSVQNMINPYSEWQHFMDLAKIRDLRFIVSNTTEAGIHFSSEDKFNDSPQKEFPAKLTVWLYNRFKYFEGDPSTGCILLPCELIENNGSALKLSILRYIKHWNLPNDFKKWILRDNHFCSTLVDRIVSGYPWERAQDLETTLGYQDKLLVAGEYYHSWVIQGPKTVEQELPFSKTNLNVQFVNDLVPHPEMKVRILNGAHTALVPIGYLAGFRTVKEAMENPIIRDFVKSLLIDETISTLDIPEVVKKKFLEDVLDRFYNPFLKHNLTSISLNSTSKFVTCLLPTLKDYYGSEGNLPRRIVFILSALIRFYKGEYNEETIEIQDDKYVIKFFRSVWMDYNSINITLLQMVQTILENSKIWGEDLTLLNGLSESVISDLESIEKNGIKGSLLKKFSK